MYKEIVCLPSYVINGILNCLFELGLTPLFLIYHGVGGEMTSFDIYY